MFLKQHYYQLIKIPLVHLIKLPKPSPWLYLSFYYKAGYIFEKKANLSHLFEHYLVGTLIKKGIPQENIKAYTDAEFIELDFRFLSQKFLEYFKIILDTLLNLEFDDEDNYNKEKQKVYREIQEKGKEFNLYLQYIIQKEVFSTLCPYRKVYNYFEPFKVLRLELEDLERFYQSQIKFSIPIINIGSYKFTLKEIDSIKKTLFFYKFYFKKKAGFPKCRFKTNLKKQIKVRILLKEDYLAFVFPINYNKKTDFIERKIIQTLLEDIKNHSLKYSLDGRLKKMGVKESELKIQFYQKFGYFYYLIPLGAHCPQRIIEVFQGTIEEIKKENIIFKILLESLKEIWEKRKLEENRKLELYNEIRFYNFSDVLAIGEKPLVDKEYEERLFSLKPFYVKKLVRNLFDWKKMRIFVISSKSKKQ